VRLDEPCILAVCSAVLVVTVLRGCIIRDSEIDEDFVRLVPDAKDAGPGAAALLIECRGQTPDKLQVTTAWP